MIRAALALALLARGPGNHTQDYSHGALSQSGQTGVGIIGRYLASDGSYQTAGDACSLFSSELTAPSFCLRGDGSSTGSLALSAVGSPTTQTMAWCENGLNCGSVSRQVVSASNYFQTASMAQPGGSWWACVRGIVDAPLALSRYMGQNGSWILSVTSAGVAQFTPTGGSTLTSSAGAIVGGASQLVCASWHQVGAGSVNTATLYVDGAQIAQSTTEPPLASVSTNITAGNGGGALPISRLGFAMFGTGDPSATLFSRLAAATAPTPQGTRGEALSDTRPSASNVMAPDGVSMTVLQNNRLGVSGGVVSSPSRTSLLLWSEDFSAAAWSALNGVTVATNQTTGLDGAATADKLTATATNSQDVQTITSSASGGAYGCAVSMKTASGGSANSFKMTLFDSTSSTTLATTTATPTSSYQRVSVSVSSTTATHIIRCALWPDAVSGTGAVYVDFAQAETGSVASAYCRSEGTSSTCAGDQVTVPTPSSLSVKSGCVRACITPTFTGSNPDSAADVVLDGNSSGTARFFQINNASPSMRASDGTNTALVAGGYTSGTKSCFATRWDSGVGTLEVDNLTTGTKGTPVSFSGFGAFGTTIAVGFQGGTTSHQPLGSVISDISFGSSPSVCQ